jgi:hypothetical protein
MRGLSTPPSPRTQKQIPLAFMERCLAADGHSFRPDQGRRLLNQATGKAHRPHYPMGTYIKNHLHSSAPLRHKQMQPCL